MLGELVSDREKRELASERARGGGGEEKEKEKERKREREGALEKRKRDEGARGYQKVSSLCVCVHCKLRTLFTHSLVRSFARPLVRSSARPLVRSFIVHEAKTKPPGPLARTSACCG